MNINVLCMLISILMISHSSLYSYCSLKVSPEQAKEIGQKIWHNECRGSIQGLTSWNDGERCASMGIGHFIWYPEGQEDIFKQTFPSLIKFLESKGKKPPAGIFKKGSYACPWPDRPTFLEASSSQAMNSLRTYLANTIDLQTTFIIERLDRVLPIMLKNTHTNKHQHIKKQFYRVAQTDGGLYALIDYINFKGEGSLVHEEYKGYRWGLLQVLEKMQGTAVGSKAMQEFVTCAESVLNERIAHAPPEFNESRWFPGWKNRLATYLK